MDNFPIMLKNSKGQKNYKKNSIFYSPKKIITNV